MDPTEAILKFLESIGRPAESDFYLRLFRAESKESFATLVAEPAVLRHAAPALELDLRFLAGLGLTPVLVLGLYGPSATTDEQAARLGRRLGREEVPTSQHQTSDNDLTHAVQSAARAGQLPIVRYPAGELTHFISDRLEALESLVRGLKTRKVIFLTRRGGLRPQKAQRGLSFVNLKTDYAQLRMGGQLRGRQLLLLEHAKRLLEAPLEHRMLVSVTSPLELLRELFTVKGAGTLIKPGTTILRRTRYADVDRSRIETLLISSFGRAPLDVVFSREPLAIYLEESYQGVAIVEASPLGPYLSKFAVERQAQGEGIGRDLWQEMVKEQTTLFWRARSENPILPWYLQQCDGMQRSGEWHIFWRGLPPALVPRAIEYAGTRPADFKSRD